MGTLPRKITIVGGIMLLVGVATCGDGPSAAPAAPKALPEPVARPLAVRAPIERPKEPGWRAPTAHELRDAFSEAFDAEPAAHRGEITLAALCGQLQGTSHRILKHRGTSGRTLEELFAGALAPDAQRAVAEAVFAKCASSKARATEALSPWIRARHPQRSLFSYASRYPRTEFDDFPTATTAAFLSAQENLAANVDSYDDSGFLGALNDLQTQVDLNDPEPDAGLIAYNTQLANDIAHSYGYYATEPSPTPVFHPGTEPVRETLVRFAGLMTDPRAMNCLMRDLFLCSDGAEAVMTPYMWGWLKVVAFAVAGCIAGVWGEAVYMSNHPPSNPEQVVPNLWGACAVGGWVGAVAGIFTT